MGWKHLIAAAALAGASAAASGAGADDHVFTPSVFYNTYSFAHPPRCASSPATG